MDARRWTRLMSIVIALLGDDVIFYDNMVSFTIADLLFFPDISTSPLSKAMPDNATAISCHGIIVSMQFIKQCKHKQQKNLGERHISKKEKW